MRVRPLPLILGSLAVAGVVKAGLAVGADPGALPDLLVSRAEAAGLAAEPEPDHAETPAEPAAAPPPQDCEMPEEMFEAVTLERSLLEQQQEDMTRRTAEVELAREQLGIEADRLDGLKTELEGLLAKVEESHSGDLDRLVNLYRNMKPGEAAAIMNELDLEVSVMVLGAMSERDAAPIMAQLTPLRAQAISRIIFERARLPGDQRLDNIRIE